MKKYILNIGLNDKDTKIQRVSTVEAYKIIENVIVEKVGGGSIYEGRGIYKHDNGEVVVENSLEVQLFDCDEAIVLSVIDILKSTLNQESIVLTVEDVNSRFV